VNKSSIDIKEGRQAVASEIKFPPVENGLDYLKSAAEHLRDEPTARDLKYAVLHLHSAVEVLLKVRLMREHWSLIFSNTGKRPAPLSLPAISTA
jgi:hypothetical protein